ncbi:unnamed protein product [Heligmosomoides polygyrus]|uniref:Amino acid transporter n=1 Tax=Heligmosomoides polygyrus TaxID=6339 RepID=A0A183FQC6_HELPZ|nr:unnamed protein product [Heligmosomoides polygyrus]
MSSTCLQMRRFCRDNTLLVMTIVSVVLGVTLGFSLRPLNLSAETLQLINFPGEIFMQVLKMMILPLIFSSLISGVQIHTNINVAINRTKIADVLDEGMAQCRFWNL